MPTRPSLHDACRPYHTARHVRFLAHVGQIELPPRDSDEQHEKSSTTQKTSLVDLLKDAVKRRAAFDKAYDELPAHLRCWNDDV